MLANEIANLRQNMGLSQTQFAQLFGIHPITVIRWEKGTAIPTDYQKGLMESFKTANDKPEAKEVSLGAMIVTAGAIAVLAFLLGLAVVKIAKKG